MKDVSRRLSSLSSLSYMAGLDGVHINQSLFNYRVSVYSYRGVCMKGIGASEMFACARSVVQVVRRLRTVLTTLGRYADPEVVISGVLLHFVHEILRQMARNGFVLWRQEAKAWSLKM